MRTWGKTTALAMFVFWVALVNPGALIQAGTTAPDSDADGISDVDELQAVQRLVFAPPRSIPLNVLTTPYAEPIDFDLDGDFDILANDGDEIIWYENLNGAGMFGARQMIAVLPSRVVVAFAGDLEPDGDVDVFVASGNFPERSVAIIENLGDESFAAPVTVTEPNGWVGKAVGDIDADGDLDLILLDVEQVFLFVNLGPGLGFAASTGLGGRSPAFVQLVDLDGDTDLDILIGSYYAAAWFENDGVGGFGLPVEIDPDRGFEFHVAAGDINGDGHLDIVSQFGAWHPGPPDAAGSFGSAQTLPNTCGYVFVSDLDRDGDNDVLCNREDHFWWFRNLDGQGDFGAFSTLVPAWSTNWVAHLVDIDGDGNDDIVSSDWDNGMVWYRNASILATDPFDADTDDDGLLDGEELTDSLTDPNLADTDGDGLDDAFEMNFGFDPHSPLEHADDPDGDGMMNLAENAGGTDPHLPDTDGDGLSDAQERGGLKALGFGEARHVATGGIVTIEQVVIADRDGDGDNDILLGSVEAAWYENLDGRGGEFGGYPAQFEAAAIAVGDLDADGDLDVATLTATQGLEWVATPDASAHRIDRDVDVDGDPQGKLAAGDFDADGDLDLVVLHRREAYWYENVDGLGTFGPGILVNTLVLPQYMQDYIYGPLATAQLHGTRYTDLVVGLGSTTGWFASGPSGPAVPLHVDDFYGGWSGLFVTPFDYDLDLDIDVVSSGMGVIRFYENADGLGGLVPTVEAPSEDSGGQAVDLDGDGDPDLLTWSLVEDGDVAWWENIGGSFQRHTLFPIGDIKAVAAGDIDGDGNPDLVTYGSVPAVVVWRPHPGSDPLDELSPAPEPSRMLLGACALATLAWTRRRAALSRGRRA